MEKREGERLPGYLSDDFDWCCLRIAQLQKETGGVALPLVRCPENDHSHVTNFRAFCKYGLLRKVKEMVTWWNEQGKDQTLLFGVGNRFGETALMLAAKYAQLEVVDYLLAFKGSCDPNFSAITPRRTRDQLPLTSACKSYSRACFARKQTRHIETVLSLLEAGARSSVNDPSDLTPALRAASWTGSQTLLRLLLCYQVAENSRKKPTLAEAMDWIEQLKDCQAVAVPKSTMGKEIFRLKGRAHHARHLLLTRRRREGNEMEAEENEEEAEEFDANEEQDEVQNGRYRISPLEFACREGYWNVVTVMLAKESIRARMQQDQVKWIQRRRPHMTPLHFACLNDHLVNQGTLIEQLVEAGASLWIPNKKGQLPFDLASKPTTRRIYHVAITLWAGWRRSWEDPETHPDCPLGMLPREMVALILGAALRMEHHHKF